MANKIFDSVQNYTFQDGHNYIFNLPHDIERGSDKKERKLFSPYHGRRKTEIGDKYMAKIRELSLEEPVKKRAKKKRRKIFVPEKPPSQEEFSKKVPAKLREALPFSLEGVQPELGFSLASLFEDDGEKKAFEYLEAHRLNILAKRARMEALEAENARKQLLARLRKEEERSAEEWQRAKEQIQKILIIKAMRAKEEQELLTILALDDDDMLLLIN